jgi:bifunctional non-homologous end joining protein LigD
MQQSRNASTVRYEPDRRSWLKTKCLNREEFVVVGWSDPEGSRHRIGALLLGYYTPDANWSTRAGTGTGTPDAELERLWRRLQPLAVDKMPLSAPPPGGGRFGSPRVLSRVHWVRPEMVIEVSYAEWTPNGFAQCIALRTRTDCTGHALSRVASDGARSGRVLRKAP